MDIDNYTAVTDIDTTCTPANGDIGTVAVAGRMASNLNDMTRFLKSGGCAMRFLEDRVGHFSFSFAVTGNIWQDVAIVNPT